MDKICLYYKRTSGLKWPDAELANRISPLRAEKLSNIKRPENVLQSLAAELALCDALKAMGLPFSPPEYSYDSSGKPVLACGTAHISLTHTAGLAICAIADTPVGVDAERLRILPDAAARMILSSEERKVMPEKDAAWLLEKWVIKESLVKLTGLGAMKGRFTSFTVRDGRAFLGDGKSAGYQLLLRGEYLISVASASVFTLEEHWETH